MLCECGQREATVHEVVIRQGKKTERHLCEQCARAAGLAPPAPTQMADLLGKLVTGPGVKQGKGPGNVPTKGTPKGKPAPAAAIVQASASCASCGATFGDFKASGMLGCPDCYRTYEALIGPLLERAHDGGVHHVGKVPRAALDRSRRAGEAGMSAILGDAIERAKRVASLRKALEEAVAGEQYERAARLRDELGQIGEVRET
ncbi:MAG: UvrB/UvrC motif-containing protein [Phycisphaerales bacterium]